MMPTFVTPRAWQPSLQHPRYGGQETYARAAAWLRECASVADWGGGTGYLGALLPASVTYTVVDGTLQGEQVLADLATYTRPSEGICLRHVLDNTPDWRSILRNALAAFEWRMVVVTFTPDSAVTTLAKMKSGWPIWHFNPEDLRGPMQAAGCLVCEDTVRETHPERIYYLERPCAS